MAEFMEEFRERQLPEYEELKSLGICPDEQIRDIMCKRESLVKKLFQGQKSVSDYTKCIQCELTIHAWVTQKEKSQGKNLTSLKHSIVTRIVNLYREALRKFPNEVSFWENFILFCKKSSPNEVTGVYEKMISYHGDKTRVWCDAGIWAYEHAGSMHKVNEIFLCALQRHPGSETLNIIFFQLLLKEASKMLVRREREIGLERATLVYRNSKTNISNVTYYLKLLKCCEEETQFVNMTIGLQKEIIENLMENFPREELVWDVLAQRELEGYSMIDLKAMPSEPPAKDDDSGGKKIVKESYHTDHSYDIENNEKNVKDILSLKENYVWQRRTPKRRIELCLHVYQTGLRSVPTPTMSSIFINAMLKLNHDLTTQATLKRKCLAIAFKESHDSKLMVEEHYYACIKMLLKHSKGYDSAQKMLSEATHLRKSLRYYEIWMMIYITMNDDIKLMEIFDKAKKNLSATECIPLWRLAIQFYKTRPDINRQKFLQLLKDAAMQLSLEFAPFRSDYLEYYASTMTLEKTRQVYDELSQMPPPCLELHKKMADIESKALTMIRSDKARWRQCYENAVHYFGKANTQVWLDYIQFERTHGCPKNTTLLYQRAVNTLAYFLIALPGTILATLRGSFTSVLGHCISVQLTGTIWAPLDSLSPQTAITTPNSFSAVLS